MGVLQGAGQGAGQESGWREGGDLTELRRQNLRGSSSTTSEAAGSRLCNSAEVSWVNLLMICSAARHGDWRPSITANFYSLTDCIDCGWVLGATLPCCSWSWRVTMISSLSELAGEAGPGGPHSVGGTSGTRGEPCSPLTGTVRDTGLVCKYYYKFIIYKINL